MKIRATKGSWNCPQLASCCLSLCRPDVGALLQGAVRPIEQECDLLVPQIMTVGSCNARLYDGCFTLKFRVSSIRTFILRRSAQYDVP